jgi:transcriptional regulator with XRE-family HTH domain
MNQLAENIRIFRQLRHLPQKYMAEQLGMSQGNFAKIENGKVGIPIHTLERIAALLECSKDVLMHFDAEGIKVHRKKKEFRNFLIVPESEFEKRIDRLETHLNELFTLVVDLAQRESGKTLTKQYE